MHSKQQQKDLYPNIFYTYISIIQKDLISIQTDIETNKNPFNKNSSDKKGIQPENI